jgi:hypothetical protein
MVLQGNFFLGLGLELLYNQSSPCQFLADGGKTAQVTGRADKAWAVTHAEIGMHAARLMRAAVGGDYHSKEDPA